MRRAKETVRVSWRGTLRSRMCSSWGGWVGREED